MILSVVVQFLLRYLWRGDAIYIITGESDGSRRQDGTVPAQVGPNRYQSIVYRFARDIPLKVDKDQHFLIVPFPQADLWLEKEIVTRSGS